MTPTYFLSQDFLAPEKNEVISAEKFFELKQARALLSDALDFEQRYEVLIGNFISMELAFTELCLRSTVEIRHDYPGLAKILQVSNRHIANVLTAAKSYLDQVAQDFKMSPMTPNFQEVAEELAHREYDRSLEYRFMEALRNYTQHHAFPATGFTGSFGRQEANDWVEAVKVTAKKVQLFAHKKFKRKFLEDLPDEIDLRIAARSYVNGIGRIHVALRQHTAACIGSARALIEQTKSDFSENEKFTSRGLCAFGTGEPFEKVQLLTEWDDVRTSLVEKNERPVDLWPRQRGEKFSAIELKRLRENVGHSIEQAARLVDISSELWERYEAGLRIPACVQTMYQLLTKQHQTWSLNSRNLNEAGH